MAVHFNIYLHRNSTGMKWKISFRSSLNMIKYTIEDQIDSLQAEAGDEKEENGRGEYGRAEADYRAESFEGE